MLDVSLFGGNSMDDYNEIFWDNVIRWQKYKKLRDVDMATRFGIKNSSYATTKNNRIGVSTKKIGSYIEALEVEPADLFDEWTDDEWEKFVEGHREVM